MRRSWRDPWGKNYGQEGDPATFTLVPPPHDTRPARASDRLVYPRRWPPALPSLAPPTPPPRRRTPEAWATVVEADIVKTGALRMGDVHQFRGRETGDGYRAIITDGHRVLSSTAEPPEGPGAARSAMTATRLELACLAIPMTADFWLALRRVSMVRDDDGARPVRIRPGLLSAETSRYAEVSAAASERVDGLMRETGRPLRGPAIVNARYLLPIWGAPSGMLYVCASDRSRAPEFLFVIDCPPYRYAVMGMRE